MPTAKTTVTITALDAEGDPLANRTVWITLQHGGAGGEVDDTVIADRTAVVLDADGEASVDLYPNSAITPANTYYTFVVDGSTPTTIRNISVPSSPSTIDWSNATYNLSDPTPPVVIPDAASGTAGQVLRVASDGQTWAVGNHNDIAGRSTASAHPAAAVSTAGLTVPKASTIVADWEAVTAAPVSGVSAERIAAMSAVLPLYVTRDGSTAANVAQDQHNVALLALAEAEGARTDLAEVGEAIRTAADVAAEDARSVAPRFTLACAADGDHDTPAYTTDPPADFTTGAYFRFDLRPLDPTNVDDTPADGDNWYAEIATQTADGIGLWDNFEVALERRWSAALGRWVRGLFFEWTEIGGTSEAHSLSTNSTSPAGGVVYEPVEIPAAGGEFAVHLDFENSDGDWDLSFWRRTYEDGGTTFDGASWVRMSRAIGDGPTSIKTGVSYPWAFGYGQGEYEMESLTIRNGGPSGTILAAPTAALAYAEGDGQPFDDPQGNTWTPGADATVSVPSSGGSVADGSITTAKLAADAVTFAKMQNIATARLLGRNTSGSGDVEELDASTARTLLGLGSLATQDLSSMGQMVVQPAAGEWFSQPHGGITTGTPTLNRLFYVPIWIPRGLTAVDGIAVEVTTTATSSLCRLGLYSATSANKPGTLLIDGGTVDFSSGGGAAGVRTLTITSTAVTADRLYYVAVVEQGATAAMRVVSNGESLRAAMLASSTVADVFASTTAACFYEAGVSGALPSTATPVLGVNQSFAAPLVALKRPT